MKNSLQNQNLLDLLLNECKKGNRRSQFELYKLYYKAMFNTSYRIVGNSVEAEDLMQESFLKAFQKLDTYKGEVNFGAWLKKIVINRSLDFLRKKKLDFLKIEDNLDLIPQEELNGEWEIEDKLKLKEVLSEIQRLPEGYRVVLTLYLLEGYDHDEISEILNISPSTSRSQFIRAKKRLIENFNENKSKNTT